MRLREHIAAVLAVVLLLVSAGASSCQTSCGLQQMGMAGRAHHACRAGAAGSHAMAGMQAAAGNAAMAMPEVRTESMSPCGGRVCVQPVPMQVGKVGPGGADRWAPWQVSQVEPLLFAERVAGTRRFVCLPVARSCLVRSLQSQMRV